MAEYISAYTGNQIDTGIFKSAKTKILGSTAYGNNTIKFEGALNANSDILDGSDDIYSDNIETLGNLIDRVQEIYYGMEEETWTFTLDNGTTVVKNVKVGT